MSRPEKRLQALQQALGLAVTHLQTLTILATLDVVHPTLVAKLIQALSLIVFNLEIVQPEWVIDHETFNLWELGVDSDSLPAEVKLTSKTV